MAGFPRLPKPPLLEGTGGSGSNSIPATPVAPANPVHPDTPSTPSDNPGGNTPSNPSTPAEKPGTSTPSAPSNPSTPSQGVETSKPDAKPGTPSDKPDRSQKPSDPVDEPGHDVPANEPALGAENRHFHSDYAGVRFLSRVTSTRYMDHDYDLAWRTIEAAARMAILGAVPQMAYSANMGAVDAAEGRAVFSDKAPQMSEALNGHSWAFWLVPMYRNLQGYNLRAYNLDYNFSGALGALCWELTAHLAMICALALTQASVEAMPKVQTTWPKQQMTWAFPA